MPTATIYDPAGPTTDFFLDTDLPDLISATPTLLTSQAPVLTGPFAGQTATIQWLGSFNLATETGLVSEWRELVGGNLLFRLVLDAPVALEDLFAATDAAFARGFTYIGNASANRMDGDVGNDDISGGGGNDILLGLAGNDLLSGGSGADALWGGAGRDRLVGQSGDDTLLGGANVDNLLGGLGNDTLGDRDPSFDLMSGGAGNDRYIEFAGNTQEDRIIELAGEGYDVVLSYSQGCSLAANVEELRMVGSYANTVNALGNGLANLIVGSRGRDFINSFDGDDRVDCGDGDDLATGGQGNDTLLGGSGDDQLWDYFGNNNLRGGTGNDSLEAGSGQDTLSGGGGADTFVFATAQAAGRGGARDLITDFVSGRDTVDLQHIDADTTQAGDQAFSFIGAGPFTGAAGELRFVGGILYGNTDDDLTPEFGLGIRVANAVPLTAADFVL